MRIKLAILEKDLSYLKRIVSVFESRYADKLEIYSFTDYDVALKNLKESKIDVFIASEGFDVDCRIIPERCAFAYFVEFQNIDSIKEQVAICKFQKSDLIYKQILSLYSEKAADISGLKLGEDMCNSIAFTSVAGGTGASTIAVACAVRCANEGLRTLYLNLDVFGSSDEYFYGEGQFTMSDIIYALKSKKTNLKLKIESCMRQDAIGVNFFSQTKTALDMMELGTEDKLRLISELQMSGDFDVLIADMKFGMDKDTIEIFKKMQNIVLIADGDEIANNKLVRMYDAMLIKEKGMDISLLSKTSLIYNKYSNKSGKEIVGTELKVLGGAPKIAGADARQIINKLAGMNIFGQLI